MEDKKVKAGSVAVGICLFVIAILLVLIVVFFYNSTMEKNNLQVKINELENKISKVSDVLGENTKLEKEKRISGEFGVDGEFFTGNGPIIFNEDGTCEGVSEFSVYGKYTIENDVITLCYTSQEYMDENGNIKLEKIDEYTVKLIIKDDDTLVSYEYPDVKYYREKKATLNDIYGIWEGTDYNSDKYTLNFKQDETYTNNKEKGKYVLKDNLITLKYENGKEETLLFVRGRYLLYNDKTIVLEKKDKQ